MCRTAAGGMRRETTPTAVRQTSRSRLTCDASDANATRANAIVAPGEWKAHVRHIIVTVIVTT